jgi:peptidoglycan hydrolase-like protein with peptidoglycan-binding domain
MSRNTFALLVLAALATQPRPAAAQADTTRRRDTTRTREPRDTTRRVQEARGEIDAAPVTERFGVGRPNFGFSSDQAIELQQALTRSGCDVGTADGVVGQRTLVGIQCYRDQRNLGAADFESVLTALSVSFAKPAEPPPPPEPPPPRLPIVLRPDSNYRPDVRARRDSIKRDSVRRDSVRRDSVRRDSTRRDSTRRPDNE